MRRFQESRTGSCGIRSQPQSRSFYMEMKVVGSILNHGLWALKTVGFHRVTCNLSVVFRRLLQIYFNPFTSMRVTSLFYNVSHSFHEMRRLYLENWWFLASKLSRMEPPKLIMILHGTRENYWFFRVPVGTETHFHTTYVAYGLVLWKKKRLKPRCCSFIEPFL